MLEQIEGAGISGMTNIEIGRALGWPINRVTGRVFELRTAGLVAHKRDPRGNVERRKDPETRNSGAVNIRVGEKQGELF